MTLAIALRQRALLTQHFKTRKLRVRAVAVRPARHPSAASLAYLAGIRELLAVLRQAITQFVLPELPRVLAEHAATRPVLERTDSHGKRVAIIGAPRAGKTTAALELGERLGLTVHHADDLIPLGWSEASDALALQITEHPDGIFEGVAVVRALRKLLAQSTDKPVDQVLVLRAPHQPLSDGQARMAAGCETVLAEIEPELRARGVEFVHEAAAVCPSERKDAAGDAAKDLFDRVRDWYTAHVPVRRIALLAQSSALRVSAFNATQLEQQIKQVVKIDLFAPDVGIADNIEAFVASNVLQINGLTDSTIKTAHSILLDGARQGLAATEVAKRMRDSLAISDRRAAFLASDQIGSLNGELTQLRQTSLGVKRYKWATSNDERVRPDHAALDGTPQSWSAPPVVNQKTGKRANPGLDVRCRCTGIPILEDLLQEAGLVPANVQFEEE